MSSIFYDWFIFSGNLYRYETCWSVTNHLNIPTFQTQKYDSFSIRANIFTENYTCIKTTLTNLNVSQKQQFFFFGFSSVYRQHKGSQRTSKILRAVPLVLALLSRNCPLRKPIKQSFLLFLSFFFYVPQKLSKKFEHFKFVFSLK